MSNTVRPSTPPTPGSATSTTGNGGRSASSSNEGARSTKGAPSAPRSGPRVFTKVSVTRDDGVRWRRRMAQLPDTRNRLIVVVSLAIATSLVLLDAATGGWVGKPLRALGGTVFGPVEVAVSGAIRPIATIFDGESAEKFQALQQENAALRDELAAKAARADIRAEAARISALTAGRRVVVTRIVGTAPTQNFAKAITIDAGSVDGIEPDMAVVNDAGLVGRVIRTNLTTATVGLITDAGISVGTRLPTSGELGIATGDGAAAMHLSLMDPLAKVAVGDRVVTMGSPSERPYPAGLLIGTVSAVESSVGSPVTKAVLTPAMDPSRLDHLSVILSATAAAGKRAVTGSKNSVVPQSRGGQS